MRFNEVLLSCGLPSVSGGDVEIASLTADSRKVQRGGCFVAVRGPSADGHAFIPAAVAAGCSAIVCGDASAVPAGVPHAVVKDSRAVVGPLAQAFWGKPADRITTVGVTGTKGKSTTTYLLRSILARAGGNVALLGTISYETGRRNVEANNTTPGPVELAEMMAEMAAEGKTHLVMEVSSHALDQHRTAGLTFAAAAFTNLTGEHLDYHKTMDEYLAAKKKLFERLPMSSTAVINQDDPSGKSVGACTRARVIWYGISAAADLRAVPGRMDDLGSEFDLQFRGRRAHVVTPLIGRHNVYNCLAAAGCCLGLGIDLKTVAAGLAEVTRVPGRLERVNVEAPYRVFVDYAHTDDALANVLSALRPATRGRLMVVFGCGGDRDRAKRPRMARVAQTLADVVIVTSDNPRTEQPQAIIDEVCAGFETRSQPTIRVEIDRRKAIELAIQEVREGDVLIIAGKGHENYQIVGTKKTHFDDTEVAQELMRRREGQPS